MRRKRLEVIVLAASCVFCLSSCLDKDVYQGSQEEEKEFNDFDYSTTQSNVSLEVSYLNNGVKANVYFELYDEMPVTETEYTYVKRDDVQPLFAAYTDKNSVFKGTVDLPGYVKKVYIYTPAFFARTLIEAEVTNGSIKATDDMPTTRVVTPTPGAYHYSYMDETITKGLKEYPKNWKIWLGTYDHYRNGEIGYPYSGNLAATNADGLYEAQTKVININNRCPDIYRNYYDMTIDKTAEIVVTYLGQNTCWNSSLGYYYYEIGHEPSSLDDVHVIMLFPNTQDGQWVNDTKNATKSAGIDRSTAVQLKYYPNIASGSMEGETTVFPAGYKIGFVLATNAWSNPVGNRYTATRYRAATSKNLSVKDGGAPYNEPRTAVYRYGDWIMTSFEDFNTDQNFSDVVITLKSNPVDAITDVPVVDPDDLTVPITLKGVYAFEDLWPNQGDYDMNDVVVRYNYGKSIDTKSNIQAETFIFKVFENVANNNNGLAFKLNSNGNIESYSLAVRKAGESVFTDVSTSLETGENVFVLTDNVKENMNGEYKVTVKYKSPITKESEIDPFIFKNQDNGLRWEVHLPKAAPTSKADKSYFGQGQDASNSGTYYVRDGNYPFAIYLAGATENDLSKILDIANESTPIGQLYSGYDEWVKSEGRTNQDWYKR